MKKEKILAFILSISICLNFTIKTYASTNVNKQPVTKSIQAVNVYDLKNIIANDKASVTEEEQQDLLTKKLSIDEFYKRHPALKKDFYENQLKLLKIQQPSQNSKSLKSIVPCNYETASAAYLSNFDNLIDGTYGGDQSISDNEYVKDTGCGATTAANILAYHAKYYGRTSLFPYDSYSIENMKEFVDLMFKYIPGPCTDSTMYCGVLNYVLPNMRYNYDLRTCWSTSSDDFKNLIYFMQNSINNNNPVALQLGFNYPGTSYEPNLAYHWVTVTGYSYSGGTYEITVSS